MRRRPSTRAVLGVASLLILTAGVGVAVGLGQTTERPADLNRPGTNPASASASPTTAAPVADFPDASTTGVRPWTTLRPSGSITVTTDGAVLEGLDISGSIQIQADNVTIRKSRIRNPRGTAINVDPSTRGALIEDVEIDGTGNTDASSAIQHNNYTLRRVHIHHFGEGPRANGNVVIENSYMHTFTNFIPQGAHQDVIQSLGGSNLTVRNNTLLMNVDGGNAVLMLGTTQGHNVLVENNLVAGGGATFYGGDSNGWTNVAFVNNRISTRFYPKGGYWGPFLYAGNSRKSGNVWHETGAPVN